MSRTLPLHSQPHSPLQAPPRRIVRNIALRRAVLRVLLRARAPVTVAEIVRVLEDDDHIAIADVYATTASQRISNLLGWQVRQGRVRRVARGRYLAVAEAIPPTTRWRIEHWDELE